MDQQPYKRKSIRHRVYPGVTSVRLPANGLVHRALQTLDMSTHPLERDGHIYYEARIFGLGTCAHAYVCQTLELCGFVVRVRRKVLINTTRRGWPANYTDAERDAAKTVGIADRVCEERTHPVRWPIVHYRISSTGKEALRLLNAAIAYGKATGPMYWDEHDLQPHRGGGTYGYKYVTVPVRVTQSAWARLGNVTW